MPYNKALKKVNTFQTPLHAGHLIGHIKDIGLDPANPDTRLYATRAAQPW
jgi:hypothetical protein